MFTSHDLSNWLEIPLDEYMKCARGRPPGLSKDMKFHPLLRDMRQCIPVPGDTWVKDIDVLIEPGQSNHQGQREHAHEEWTGIFYVAVGDPVVPIVVEGERVEPSPGDFIVLPPRVVHGVAPSHSKTHRLSFAMLVADPDIPTKFETAPRLS